MSRYQPALPPYVPPSNNLSRNTASSINNSQMSSAERAVTITGLDQVMPVIYGEDRTGGLYLARPVVPTSGTYAGKLVCAIGWSWGEIEGVQALYINGAALPGAGVAVTHYTGTAGQTASPILSAAGVITGFADTFANWAYSVIVIDAGVITGWPRFEAVVRGRKVLDPRTAVTAWSRNPGLCLADFIQSTLYGPGRTVTGTAAVADRCDSLVGGVEARSQMGITIGKAASLDDHLGTLSAYAECLWQYDGAGVLLVPDAPVVSPAAVLTEADIIEGSIKLTGASLRNAPTAVTVRYMPSSGNATAWLDLPARQVLPGVDDGTVPELSSDVSMPGIRRASEAGRKALMRLRRLQLPGNYAWQAFDDGVKFQRGDVVQLPNAWGLTGRLVRVLSVEMIDPGVHQISAEHYDAALYPDDVPAGTATTVPVGAVVPLYSGSVPAGWSAYTAADGKLLVGARGTFAQGATGGSASIALAGSTSTLPVHVGTGVFPSFAGSASGTPAVINFGTADGSHAHAYTGSATLEPQYRAMIWIQKTGSPDVLPTNAAVLSNGSIISGALTAVTTYIGRLAKAGAAASGGVASPAGAAVTVAAVGNHTHGSMSRLQTGTGFMKYIADDAGAHGHGGSSVSLTLNPKRRKMALYVAGGEAEIVPGAVVGWPFASLPAASGWHWCDGTAGTIDLRDYYVEFSDVSGAGAAVGNNTATWSGSTSAGGAHSHRGTQIISDPSYADGIGSTHSSIEPAHTHGMSGSVAYQPPYFALSFIQFTGVP